MPFKGGDASARPDLFGLSSICGFVDPQPAVDDDPGGLMLAWWWGYVGALCACLGDLGS
jgi:hypothetical protein